jgi:hypothetical protein
LDRKLSPLAQQARPGFWPGFTGPGPGGPFGHLYLRQNAIFFLRLEINDIFFSEILKERKAISTGLH